MTHIHDLAGIGIGPFNLTLAALAEPTGLTAVFLDGRDEFRWHPGLMLDGATLQVPFLADLVTMVDPTSRWSFLSYLREHDRLFPFYIAERFRISRREYDHYCRWVAESLPLCRFGARVHAVMRQELGARPRGILGERLAQHRQHAAFIPDLNMPNRFDVLGAMLAERGHSEARIAKILGGNFARVMGEVWVEARLTRG